MSFVTRQAAHCDVCDHEWLTNAVPSHCASNKCRSRKWNKDAVPEPKVEEVFYTSEGRTVFDRETKTYSKPQRFDMQHFASKVRLTPKAALHDPKTCLVYRCGICAVSK